MKELKKVGKEVLFLKTSEENSRIGEGAFVRLRNQGIMFAFSDYLKGKGKNGKCNDEDECRISACISYDEGETWGEKRVLLTKQENAQNIMSVSFLRLQDGGLAMFYIEKYMKDLGIFTDKICMKVSMDEGVTWGNETVCFPMEGYHILNNDRVIRLASGRILVPVAVHNTNGFEAASGWLAPGRIAFSVSDDDGRTWRMIPQMISSPFKDRTQLQEPGVYQHEDGEIWMWCRTGYGCQYMAFSRDDGETWSELEPGTYFTSPASPMQVKKVGTYTVAVFNPIPWYCGRDTVREPWGRTPIVCAVSTDDGKSHNAESFSRLFYLEDDYSNSYCYPAIFEGNKYFLAAYYHSNDSGYALDSTKIIKVEYTELADSGTMVASRRAFEG